MRTKIPISPVNYRLDKNEQYLVLSSKSCGLTGVFLRLKGATDLGSVQTRINGMSGAVAMSVQRRHFSKQGRAVSGAFAQRRSKAAHLRATRCVAAEY